MAIKGVLLDKYTTNKQQRFIRYVSAKGKTVEPPVGLQHIHPDLLKQTEAEVEIEFDSENGQPRNIRAVGSNWTANTQQSTHTRQAQQGAATTMHFHNPYNFAPAPPRDKEKLAPHGLGDATPAGHDAYFSERFCGRLRVRLTTKTPLVLTDAARVRVIDVQVDNKPQKHKIYPLPMVGGKPHIAPTAIKGMLRTAFEIITNSRFSVFTKHDESLAYRMMAEDGLRAVPARFEKNSSGESIKLLIADTNIGDDGKPKLLDPRQPRGERETMYAAWLPKFATNRRNFNHGDEVWAYITKWQHQRPRFTFFSVSQLEPYNASVKPTVVPTEVRRTSDKYNPIVAMRGQWVRGYVCVTGDNIGNKHDERVFFEGSNTAIISSKTDIAALKKNYSILVKNYRQQHLKPSGKLEPPPKDERTGRQLSWSRHIANPNRATEENLVDKTLCYANIKPDGASWVVTELYPVMISRKLFPVEPSRLMDASMMPAEKRDELSPVDRVFGWVNQSPNGKGAYRGQLRIGAVECESTDAIQDFGDNPLPLAILGQPKPQQGRFYVAANKNGDAQANGQTNHQAGYDSTDTDKGLRGRKVYPHHASLPQGFWEQGYQPTNNFYREFLRPDFIEDNQNRSIAGWVKPDKEFDFDIHFIRVLPIE